MAKRFAPPILRWRYDTIVLSDSMDRTWHLNNFRGLCRMLSPYTSECIFSFCDYYKKTIRNMEQRVPDHWRPSQTECKDLAEELAEIAGEWGITLASCAHDSLLSERVIKARCIDPVFLRNIVDSDERLSALDGLKVAPTRTDCGCVSSRDIGAYDTCPHGCVYCYANSNPAKARQNFARISPEADCLDPRSALCPGDESCHG